MKSPIEIITVESQNKDNSYWLLPLSAIVGALVCAVLLTYITIVLMPKVSVWEMGIGFGIFMSFVIAPINAILGAVYGVIVCKALLLLKQEKVKYASRLCILAGLAIIIYCLVMYPLGWNPAGYDHISTVTNEHSTKAQNMGDYLSDLIPLLVVAIPVLCMGILIKLFHRNDRSVHQEH